MNEVDLTAVKVYALEEAQQMKAATEAFRQTAETYYSRVAYARVEQPDQDPYEYLMAEYPAETVELLYQYSFVSK
jgi:hypothetical protein